MFILDPQISLATIFKAGPIPAPTKFCCSNFHLLSTPTMHPLCLLVLFFLLWKKDQQPGMKFASSWLLVLLFLLFPRLLLFSPARKNLLIHHSLLILCLAPSGDGLGDTLEQFPAAFDFFLKDRDDGKNILSRKVSLSMLEILDIWRALIFFFFLIWGSVSERMPVSSTCCSSTISLRESS